MGERISAGAEGGGLAERLLPHLDSAYNLARWLVHNGDSAEDIVQEAYLRALQYAGGFRGGDARAWLLTIVRNTSFRWLRKTRAYEPVTEFDEAIHTGGSEIPNPEQLMLQHADGRLVEKALGELPRRFREILVLRELEGLSYKQIADVVGVPMGTVMSTLSRARERFRHAVIDLLEPAALPRLSKPRTFPAPGSIYQSAPVAPRPRQVVTIRRDNEPKNEECSPRNSHEDRSCNVGLVGAIGCGTPSCGSRRYEAPPRGLKSERSPTG